MGAILPIEQVFEPPAALGGVRRSFASVPGFERRVLRTGLVSVRSIVQARQSQAFGAIGSRRLLALALLSLQ
jgi:hypothetical protein